MRLFVGIPLTAAVIGGALCDLDAAFNRRQMACAGSAPESWHITLQFLGNTQPIRMHSQPDFASCAPPTLPIQLEGLGFFDRAGVSFAGVNLTPRTRGHCSKRRHRGNRPCGFIPETRPYHPHITLGAQTKEKEAAGSANSRVKSIADPRFSGFVADVFVLYESVPGPGGSRYEIRERFTLG